ncbi:MAG: DMT family transporter [Candidatus Pacebacteria bacterium]|nr:DMT family transporter [Candidatus Paceibacterota bacterium]
MEGFFFALIAPLLWAMVNWADKYLMTTFGAKSIFSLLTISSLVGIPVAILIGLIFPEVLVIPKSLFLIVIAGVLYVVAIGTYLWALNDEDASSILGFFQLVPIFGALLGYFFLGEILSTKYFVGGSIVILGSLLLMYKKGTKMQYAPFLRMMVSSFLYALYLILLKISFEGDESGSEYSFWTVVFWEHLVIGLTGLCMLSIKTVRKDAAALFFNNGKLIAGINITSEILTIVGNIVTFFAATFTPIALVSLATAFQPLCILLVGVVAGYIIPKYIKKEDDHLKKVIVFICMAFGVWVMA